MAVLKNKRKEGQLKVITLGDELTVYTLRMLCNENIFPKKSRWLLAGKIADLMNEFHQNLHVGNDIFVATEEDAHERHLRQTRAYSALYASASVMRTACDVVRFDRAKIAQERRKLKKLKSLLDSGKIGMDAVENHYQSWYSSAVKVSSFGMLKSMNKFYTEVFGILPKLKGTK